MQWCKLQSPVLRELSSFTSCNGLLVLQRSHAAFL